MKKIVITEEHAEFLTKLDYEAVKKMEPSPVSDIIGAVFEVLYSENTEIDEICSNEWNLDAAGSIVACIISNYNRQHPIRENTFACGYMGEPPENEHSTPNLNDLVDED